MNADIETKERPLRYVAFKNPGKVVGVPIPSHAEHSGPEAQGGQELLMCHTEDWTITVSSYQGYAFLIETYIKATGKGITLGPWPWQQTESQFSRCLEEFRFADRERAGGKAS